MSWHFSVTRLGDRVLRKTQKKKKTERKNQRADRRGGGGEQKMKRTNQKTNNPEKTRQKGKSKLYAKPSTFLIGRQTTLLNLSLLQAATT